MALRSRGVGIEALTGMVIGRFLLPREAETWRDGAGRCMRGGRKGFRLGLLHLGSAVQAAAPTQLYKVQDGRPQLLRRVCCLGLLPRCFGALRRFVEGVM